MPRPERPLDPTEGPVQAFAADLRKLRYEAGKPKYLQMARLTGRSRTALAEAAGGDHLATWPTVEAYVQACGGDVTEWEKRWTDLRDTIRAQREQPPATHIASPAPAPIRRPPRRWIWAFAAVLAAASVAAAVTAALHGSPRLRSKAGRTSTASIVIQNKVAIGPTDLTEDTTPAYLSTKPQPFCARYRCEVRGTDMWSGADLQAICVVRGIQMTNEDKQTPGIARNKGGVTTSLWYWAAMPNGITGYISEVYVTPASRNLALPACAPNP
jgi:hypothetical protein